MQNILTPGVIYSADNGRLICRECAGASAASTGRDTSGQEIEALPLSENAEWLAEFGRPLTCEAGCTSYADRAANLKTYERRLTYGTIYGIGQEDGTVKILADCQAEPTARIEFTIPGPAAARYFESADRPCIQDLFPDLRKEHREILINGTSPAAWDRMAGKRMPRTSAAFLARYGKLGYSLHP